MSSITERFTAAKDLLTRLSERRKVLKERESNLENEHRVAKEREKLLGKARQLLTTLGGRARSAISDTIDPLATEALQEIFGPDAQYRTIFKKLPKGGYSVRIVSGTGDQLASPTSTDGGSVAEILSDGVLRSMIVCLHRPPLSRVLLIDEPWAGVDSERMRSLGRFIARLCDDLNTQYIVTTHEADRELDEHANTIIELRSDQ